MTDSIFQASDPVVLLRNWMADAARTEPSDPNAMALATADADGLPDVRIVLLKEIEADGLVFYTNYDSAKGGQIAATGKAALVIHWKTLERQVRVRGTIAPVDAAQSDAYYRSRPLDSRLGARASRQSRPLADRQTLVDAVEAERARQGDNPSRPDNWGGYRLRPLYMEFWQAGDFRLHDRERWSRGPADDGWSVQRLFP